MERVVIWIGRVALIAVVLGQIVTAVWIRLPHSTLDRLLTDIRDERVAELQIDDDEHFAGTVLGRAVVDESTRMRWRTTDGSWHTFLTGSQPADLIVEGANEETDDDGFDVDGTSRSVDFNRDDPVVTVIEDTLARTPVDRGLPLSGWTDPWGILMFLGWLLVILALLTGPQPRRATKWAWFWLLGLPLGLGFLALLAMEAPWSARAVRRPEPLPHDKQRDLPGGDPRLTGGWAFVITTIGGAIAFSVIIKPIFGLLD